MKYFTFILLLFPFIILGQNYTFKINDRLFEFDNFDIYEIVNKEREYLTSFPKPTLPLFFKYRSDFKEMFGTPENKYDYMFAPDLQETTLNACTIIKNKLWVGFSFYSGEGSTGYGGIGFYDFSNKTTGVFRLPALLRCSISEIAIVKKKLYIKTIGEYELASDICNGIIIFDLDYLTTNSLVPNGPTLLHHKDGGENVSEIYNRPITKLIKDTTFIEREIVQINQKVKNEIRTKGLENYMVDAYRKELKTNESFFDSSHIVFIDTVTIDSVNTYYKIKDNLFFFPIEFKAIKSSLANNSFSKIIVNFPRFKRRSYTISSEQYSYYDKYREYVEFENGIPKYLTSTKVINIPRIRFRVNKKYRYGIKKAVFQIIIRSI